MNRSHEKGAVNSWVVLSVIFIATTIIAGGFLVWALLNYFDQKDNVDSKVAVAVAEAQKTQADIDEKKFLERDKEPNREFVGPDDYGRLVFSYPKTWSVFVAKDASKGGTFEAYLNPVTVPPTSTSTQVALRVTIEERDYDQVLNTYQSLVKKGDLKSSAVKADDQNGTRLDGAFTKDIRGSAVIFKIRDKTVTLRTDAETFTEDFNKLIATITFNK